jgi:hypothetical protein
MACLNETALQNFQALHKSLFDEISVCVRFGVLAGKTSASACDGRT